MAKNDDRIKNTTKSHVGDDVGHPVATGVGAGAGAMAGAAAGSVGGLVGAAAGAVIGGIAGALGGEGIADTFTGNDEDRHWEQNYRGRPYVREGEAYDRYQPAYRHGSLARQRHEGRAFTDVEPTLRDDWNRSRNATDLEWEHASPAVRDAYEFRSDRLSDETRMRERDLERV
jgi:hypothetical protein